MRVLLIGDVHTEIKPMSELLRRAKASFRIEAAIQVGDFGFFEDVFRQNDLADLRYLVPLYVIDGNHEDHLWLKSQKNTERIEKWKSHNQLFYQDRGTVLSLGSSRIGFLGGALHVDRPQESFPERAVSNFIQREQTNGAISLFNRESLDLLITHTCPSRIGIGMQGSGAFDSEIHEFVVGAGFDPGPKNDCGDQELTHLWNSLRKKPRAWAFGHFHQLHEARVEGTHFVSLPAFERNRDLPLVIWDTEEKRLLIVASI